MSVLELARRLAARVEALADPYAPASTPPDAGVWTYLRSNLAPLRKVMIEGVFFTMIAGVIEVWLIAYTD